MKTIEDYKKMQKDYYDKAAKEWSVDNRNPVVGSFDGHNAWKDYEYLWQNLVGDTKKMTALDFGCGVGRGIVLYTKKFKKIDGVDISAINIEKAKEWIKHNKIRKRSTFFECNGSDLSIIKGEGKYNVIYSTITFQHICCYCIRLSYLKNFKRLLKKDGYLTIQMGFGKSDRARVDYYADNFEAEGTNGECDVEVASIDQIIKDLTDIGYKNVNHYVRPIGAGDKHENWIYFNATA